MTHQLNRRALLGGLLAGGGYLALGGCGVAAADTPLRRFPLTLSDAEWRRRLSPAAYAVLRGHETERAGTSPLDRERRRGVFRCAGCSRPLFLSQAKYDSGTGWPSFYAPIRGAVGTRPDDTLFSRRTEVHCANCGGHLGHVFDDGPQPTGKRYCMNGVAMRFTPA